MSARGTLGAHSLPSNPSYIDFPISDGDEIQWPTNTTRTFDSDGHVNFMRPVPIDESLCIKWRSEIGASLAIQLKKPAGPSYVLRGWPEGYQMFDHNKGPADNPRHDAYLIGSRFAKRFRSVPEFIPHALWLLTDPTLNRANCACKYCNKKPQREITLSMGLLPKRSTPVSNGLASSSTSSPARQPRERGKPYAAIRRIPRPAKLPQGPKQHISKERNTDLRSAYGEGVELRRWFRNGELLWCALNTPIPGFTSEKEMITFWPGIVEEAKIKSEPIMKPKADEQGFLKEDGLDSVMEDGTQPGDGPQSTQNADASNQTADGDNRVPWDVVQTLWYKIKLLGISYSYNIHSDQVIPYQAHSPSDELIEAIHCVPLEHVMSADTDSFQLGSATRFIDAAAPFALAVQIAANLTGFWSPTDDWEYRFTIPPVPSTNARPPVAIPAKPVVSSGSLDSVMNASMAYNASLSSAISAAGPISSSTSALQVSSQNISQMRYQGLWWGAERIWTDELVRLKLSRAQIAPKGAENILPPAGPSHKVIEYVRSLDDGSPEDIAGAAARGVFMLVEGLYVVEVQKDDGSATKECRVSGMLYELVDEDWDAEEESGGGCGGKGKEKATEESIKEETPAASVSGAPSGSVSIEAPPGSQLANPNPAVSVENTTSDVVSHTNSLTVRPQVKVHSANEQLSRPVQSPPFSLPPPPIGFKFRPILTPGYEAIFSLNFIAGRYYPLILQHPLLDSSVGEALDVENGGLIEASQLWALEGLTPGFHNTMDPVRWRSSRAAMVREADKEARHGLQQHWLARAKDDHTSVQGTDSKDMEVD